MTIKSRLFKFRINCNAFRVLKTALVIALVYQVVPTLYEFLYPRQNLRYFNQELSTNNDPVSKYYEKRKYWLTSNLGSVLFKDQTVTDYPKNRTFVILVWKYWDWLKKRHLKGHTYEDPLDDCSVNNCIFTGDNSMLNSVDAVLVHIQHGVYPKVKKRNTTQRWVFLSDESPLNTFSIGSLKPRFSKLANIFNWSMTYRSDADVPVPYGRTVPLPKFSKKSRTSHYIPYWDNKQKDVLVTALISHCSVTKRMNYIHELEKYIKVDIFGKCSTSEKTSCPGYFRADCPKINTYLFYLAFENSGCRQYFTEKIFYNAYAKGAIPIVMGPPVSDCEKLLPPNSFLHVDNFGSPKELAIKIITLSMDDNELKMYHEWRKYFKVVNEHGYFGTKSYHLCRLCEALNYNDNKPKVYDVDSLKLYLEPKLLCTNFE